PVRGTAGLLGAMIDTAMSYRDVLQSHMPGFRERIVEIRLTSEEGRLNLDMNADRIESISRKGENAGRLLRTQFDMETHRWLRLQALMPPLSEAIEGLQRVAAEKTTSTAHWYQPGMPYRRDAAWHEAA